MNEIWALAGYRREVADAYAEVRAGPAGPETWAAWRGRRDALLAGHESSPVPAERRAGHTSGFFPHDPSWRLLADVVAVDDPPPLEIGHSGDGATGFERFAVARALRDGTEIALELYWLAGYGGGVFLPFRDATNGLATYGGGRYLLDGVKGADLGVEGDRLVLDFNYAYHPSCAHDPRWSCPLSPPANRLELPVEAGELMPGAG